MIGQRGLGPKWSRNSELCVSVFSSSKCVALAFRCCRRLLIPVPFGKHGFGSDHRRPLDSSRHPLVTIYDEFAQHTLRQGETCHFRSNMSTAPFRLLVLLYPSHPRNSGTAVRQGARVTISPGRAFARRVTATDPSMRKISSPDQ